MKHDEFQVKGHRFENEIKIDSLDQLLRCMTTRALLRVNLRGALFRTKKYIPAVNFCKTVNLILEENIKDKNYKPITSMKEVPEQLRKLRRQYLRYQQAEIIYSISHKKLFELASDAGAIYRIDGTVLINRDIFSRLSGTIS